MKPAPAIVTLALAVAPLAGGADTVLEEVVVTAGFRDTPLLNQPASTTVLTGDEIRQRAAQHLEEILNVAPNVNFASGASRARFFQIRGIGERSQFQEPLNPSIGFIVDGIDFSGLGAAATLFDARQVEILRGPQGTYHGANALAGLINIRTGQPQAEPLLEAEATAADYGSWSAGVVGSGPLVREELLYRLAVSSYRSDGFIENDYLGRDDTNDRDETTIRGKLRWLAGETGTLDITAMYVDIDNGYDAFSLDNTRHTLSDQPGKDAQESRALGLEWHGEPGAVVLEAAATAATTDTDYAYDEDWSYVGIAPGWEYSSRDQYLRDRDSYSAQLRLLSSERSRLFADSTDWVAGLYYLGEREDLRRRYTYLESDFTSRYDTDTLAVFGELDVELGERLSLVTGLRLERRQTDYSDNNGVASDPDKDLWGGRLVLEYNLADRGMLYAGASRGYRANGVNAQILASLETIDNPDDLARAQGLREFDAEYLTNYELGFKGSFARQALRTRLALFYMDREDQQVKGSLALPREDGSTNFIDYTDNAARGNNYGLELEAEWLAGERLTLYGNLGLLETEFDKYVNAAGEDLAGRDQAHAPSYQYALGGRVDLTRGFYFRLDLEGKDDFYFSDRHDAAAPSQDLVHARLGYDAGHWSVALWGRNLTDEDYYVRGFGSFGNDPRKEYLVEPYYQYGEPRLLGVSANYRF